MKRSPPLASLILTGGLAVFAVSAFAQSSPSSSPSQTDRDRSSSSGSATGSGHSSGQQGNTLHGSGGVAGASAQSAEVHGFALMDRDRDGRVSLSEFTAAAQSGAAAGSGTAGMTGRTGSNVGTGTSDPKGTAPNTRGTPGSTGVDANGMGSTGLGSTSVQMEQEFRRLDTDRDGYLSESELSTWQAKKKNKDGRSNGLDASATGSGSTSPAKPDKSKDRDPNR